MAWVVTAALLVALVATVIAGTERENQREARREPAPLVAHPWLTGGGAGLVTLAVGSLVVIALNSERRRD